MQKKWLREIVRPLDHISNYDDRKFPTTEEEKKSIALT